MRCSMRVARTKFWRCCNWRRARKSRWCRSAAGTSAVGGVTGQARQRAASISPEMDRLLELDVQSGIAMAEAGILGRRRWKKRWRPTWPRPWVMRRRILNSPPWAAGSRARQRRRELAVDGAPGRTARHPGHRRGPRPGPQTSLALGSRGRLRYHHRRGARCATAPPLVPAESIARFLFHDFEGGMAAIREAMQAEIPCSTLAPVGCGRDARL